MTDTCTPYPRDRTCLPAPPPCAPPAPGRTPVAPSASGPLFSRAHLFARDPVHRLAALQRRQPRPHALAAQRRRHQLHQVQRAGLVLRSPPSDIVLNLLPLNTHLFREHVAPARHRVHQRSGPHAESRPLKQLPRQASIHIWRRSNNRVASGLARVVQLIASWPLQVSISVFFSPFGSFLLTLRISFASSTVSTNSWT